MRYAQKAPDEGAVLHVDRDPVTLTFTIGTTVNDEVNTIGGIPAAELHRLGCLLIEAADTLPPLTHAAACPALSGGKCFCRSGE